IPVRPDVDLAKIVFFDKNSYKKGQNGPDVDLAKILFSHVKALTPYTKMIRKRFSTKWPWDFAP
ncbi:hypothetical protein PENTCL1PPCAC_23624, partial [Pristionchus entomophagus]